MILKHSVQHLFVRQAKPASCEHPIILYKYIIIQYTKHIILHLLYLYTYYEFNSYCIYIDILYFIYKNTIFYNYMEIN